MRKYLLAGMSFSGWAVAIFLGINLMSQEPQYITETVTREVVKYIDRPQIIEVEPTIPDDMELLEKVVYAEAGNQGYQGMRYVAGVIFNRVESDLFPNTINEVLTSNGQFSCVTDGGIYRHTPTEECRQAIIDEFNHRSNTDILYFRAGHYHSFGTPIFQHGDHYFSGR